MATFEVRDTKTPRGQGVFATGLIKRGDLIMSEHPLIFSIDPDSSNAYCSYCFLQPCHVSPPKTTLMRCKGCQVRHYCSKRCQRADWIEGPHKYECKILRRLSPHLQVPFVLVLVRTILRYLTDPEAADQLKQLKSHPPDLTGNIKATEHLSRFIQMAFQLIHSHSMKINESTNAALLVKLASAIKCNAFGTTDFDLNNIGTTLYTRHLNRLNHSCQPNAVVVYNGRIGRVIAMRNIQCDEEITVSYCDLLISRWEMRQSLQQQFHFSCDCSRCREGGDDLPRSAFQCPQISCKGLWTVPDELMAEILEHSDDKNDGKESPAAGKTARRPFNVECPKCHSIILDCRMTIERAFGCRQRRKELDKQWVEMELEMAKSDFTASPDSLGSFQARLADLLVNSQRLFDEQQLFMAKENSDMLATTVTHQVTLTMAQLWPEALVVGKRLLQSYEEILPNLHPRRVVQQLLVASLKLRLETPEVDRELMKNARRLLERLYGSDCSFISNTVNEFNAMMLTAARLQ